MLRVREEFSFPIITKNHNTNTANLAAVAPSLWRISSLEEYTVGCLDLDHQFEANGRKGFSTRSFSDLVGDINYMRDSSMHHDVQNKMDLLWEDLNDEDAEEEELGSKFSLDISGLDHHHHHHQEYCSEEERDGELMRRDELVCMQANLKKMSNEIGNATCGIVVSQKKTRMILVLKVLMKKLLLLHKMGRFKKFRS